MSKAFKARALPNQSAMDVVRERKRGIPRAVYAVTGVSLLVALVGWALLSLAHQPSGAIVDKSTLVTDVAVRGTLVRSVSAQGTFAPEHLRVASATQPGVVNQIFVKAGSTVYPGTPLAQMQNPSLESAAVDARSALRVAQANLAEARAQAQAAVITQRSNLSDAQAQMQTSALQAKSYAELHKRGLVANLTYQQALVQARKSENDVRSGQAQVAVSGADAHAKIAAAQAQVEQAQAQVAAAQAQVDALTVRAATAGVVQSVDVDPGTSIAQNTELARIADMRDLKAVLQVAESDVHSVAPGMRAQVDTGNGVIDGRVARIAPSAQNGTVAVDVTFPRPLPAGARPDAEVNGTVIIAKIPNTISIARPAGASDETSIDLFKVVAAGQRAVLERVRLGQGSADRIQVLSGLAPGDTVIVSDMSAYTDQSQLRLR